MFNWCYAFGILSAYLLLWAVVYTAAWAVLWLGVILGLGGTSIVLVLGGVFLEEYRRVR